MSIIRAALVFTLLGTGAVAAAEGFSDAQNGAIANLGAVTGTGLACGYGKVALPLKETMVTIADHKNMDTDARVAVREMFSKARDAAFADVGAKKSACPNMETYSVTAQLAQVRLRDAFDE
mgnify:CR=1 FL=1